MIINFILFLSQGDCVKQLLYAIFQPLIYLNGDGMNDFKIRRSMMDGYKIYERMYKFSIKHLLGAFSLRLGM